MNIESASRVVGEVVRVNILNAIENRSAHGKERPGLLVAEGHGHWWVLGLTTQPVYKSGETAGESRQPVRDPERYGLTRPSFMWSSRLARVSSIDITEHFGYADQDLVEDVIAFAGLYGHWATGLRSSAAERERDTRVKPPSQKSVLVPSGPPAANRPPEWQAPLWRRVSADDRCPLCGEATRCAMASNNLVAVCHRFADGGTAVRTVSGGIVWEHSLRQRAGAR